MSRISSPDFVGRDAQGARLTDALAAALDGRPSLVLVAGEAGIGKTRLVTQLSESARAAGVQVLVGGAIDIGDGGLPYGAIAEALRDFARVADPEVHADVIGPSFTALEQILPERAKSSPSPPTPTTNPEWHRTRVFEGVLAVLGRLTDRRPAVLILEDLHWADQSTRELLAFLLRNLGRERLLMVGTFRTDELHRRHPLVPWLVEVERQDAVDRVDLDRFGLEEQRAQVRSILGRNPSDGLIDEIHGRSDGNPFFAEELLAVMMQRPGTKHEGDPTHEMPRVLADVLLARVARVSEATQRVLGVASVGGRRVDHELLVAVASAGEADVEAAIDEAIGAQILVVENGSSSAYGFRHALAQEAVYDNLLPSRRRRLHARYAEVLANARTPVGGDGARHLTVVAHHWAAAQIRFEALRASIAAAEAAEATFAYAEAGAQYTRAIDLWDTVEDAERPRAIDDVEIHLRAAVALGAAGDNRRAVDFAREAVRRADADGDSRRAAIIRARLGRLEWQSGDLRAGLATCDEAQAMIAGGEPTTDTAEMLASLASLLLVSGSYRRAAEVAGDAVEMAIAVGARTIQGNAMNTRGAAVSWLGDCPVGVRLLEEALDIATETADLRDMARGHANLSGALAICGASDRALEAGLRGAAFARDVGLWRTVGVLQECNVASLLIDLGRWDEAAATLTRVEPDASAGMVRMTHSVNSAILGGRRGDPASRRYLDDCVDALDRMPDTQITGTTYQALIEWELFAGRSELASDAAARAVEALKRREDDFRLIRVITLGLAAEADRAALARARSNPATVEAAVTRAAGYIEELDRRMADPVAALPDVRPCLAWAAAEHSRIQGRPDRDGWAAVRAGWSALGRPFFAAYGGYREAEAALEARLPKAAAEAPLRESHAIATRLRAQPLLAWIEALARRARLQVTIPADPSSASPVPQSVVAAGDAADVLSRYGLTRREREILALLADGWTNRLIADSLFITESTAGVHVSNVIGKLGVTNRVQAAALAARLGLGSVDDVVAE